MSGKKIVKVGDPWRAIADPAGVPGCFERSPDQYKFYCCLSAGHSLPHIAGNGEVAVAVWK